MSILVTTNEPASIKDLFEDKVEIPMGYDFKLFTNSGPITIERKACPGDFLSSVTDGRLRREIIAMRKESQINILLLHGEFIFRRDGTLVTPGRETKEGRGWTRQAISNLIRTAKYVEGLYVEEALTDNDLVSTILQLQDYFDKQKHTSLQQRPKMQSDWYVPADKERVAYFYQGLPSVSGGRAKQLTERFPMPMDLYAASVEDIDSIPGFGKGLSEKIYDFLRSGKNV